MAVAARVQPEATVPATREVHAGRRPILIALLLVATVKQFIMALAYPPFQGHDEVAHLGYLWMLVTSHRLPTLSDTLPAALSPYSRFTLDWPALYTANHPPLYYLLAWPAYQLAGPGFLAKLYAVRLVAIPLFLLTVWLSYRLAVALVPGDDFVVLAVPAVIAFQPQLSFEGAIVNNDILAICLGSWLLLQCVLAVRQGLTRRRALALGFGLGLGLLSKATLSALVPLVAGVAVWCCWPRPWARVRTSGYWRPLLQRAALLVVPAVLLPLPWYLFLHHTYGDFTAFKATQELQARWNVPAGTFLQLLTSPAFHLERLRETWGYFGWKLLPLSSAELDAVYLALGLCGFGLLVGSLRLLRRVWAGGARRPSPVEPDQVAGVVVLVSACLLLYGAMIYFGTLFALTQARYVFPIFPAATVLALLGLRALVPRRWLGPATALVIAAAGAYQLLLLLGLVIPYAYL